MGAAEGSVIDVEGMAGGRIGAELGVGMGTCSSDGSGTGMVFACGAGVAARFGTGAGDNRLKGMEIA